MESEGALSLRATYRHPRAAEYRAAGGAWDVPTLDRLLTGRSAEEDAQVASVAGALRRDGVRRGDVVAWQLPNLPIAIVLLRACWRLGAVAAPLHHRAGGAEVDDAIERLQPRRVVEEHEAGALVESPVVFAGDHSRASDVAVVLWTGGSTGAPRAVLHTHRGLAHKALTMVPAHGLGPDDVVLMPAPLAHISGLLNGVLVPGAAGMRTVLMQRWDADDALDLVARERVSFMVGPPTFFLHLMATPRFSPRAVATLRLVSSGGAGVTPEFVDEASRHLGAVVKRSYGSTEAPTLTTSMMGDPPERARSTDGRVVGAAELRVTDDGELWVRGPELCAGYLDPTETRRAFTRGWFRTGDLATLDDGWLTIIGRSKDIIIRGGENIVPAEVEAVLATHPRVREAVVVGVPDEVMGERVCAFVVGEPGPAFDLDECRRWFAASGVARFKTPEHIVVVPELPLLGPGKVDRTSLAARAEREARPQ